MARGLDKHRQRQDALGMLGRALSRRSGARCELCGTGGPLVPTEIPPADEEPDLERAALLCERCGSLIDGIKGHNPDALRFLEQTVWTDTLPAKLLAVRTVRRLADADVAWAREVLETLYLDEETESLVDQG